MDSQVFELWKLTRYKIFQLQNSHPITQSIDAANIAIADLRSKIRITINDRQSEKEIEQICKKHAETRGIPLIAAKARLMPHINFEFENKFENELRDYLAALDIPEIIRVADEKAIKDLALTYKILYNEGYGDFLAIRSLYAAHPHYDKFVIGTIIDKWRKEKRLIASTVPCSIGDENNPFVFDENFETSEKKVFNNCFPEAKLYLNRLKETDIREYSRAIRRASRAIHYLHKSLDFAAKYRMDDSQYGKLDCNDLTPMHQVLSLEGDNAILQPIHIHGHVALKLNGYDLVIDTFDGKIRTKKEFIKKAGYTKDEDSAYYSEGGKIFTAKFNNRNEVVGYQPTEFQDSPYNGIGSMLVSEAMAYESIAKQGKQGHIPDLTKAIAVSHFITEVGIDENTFRNLGIFYRDMNMLDNSQDALKKCTDAFPYYSLGWETLGEIYLRQGNAIDAIQCYFTVLKIDPRNRFVFHSLIELLCNNGRCQEAEGILREQLSTFPEDERLRDDLRKTLLKSGKYAEYETELRLKDSKFETVENKKEIAYALNEQGKLKEAREMYKLCHKRNPYDEITLIRLAAIYSTIDKGASKRYFMQAKEFFDTEWQIVQRILQFYEGGKISSQQIVQLFLNLENYEVSLMLAKRYSVIHNSNPTLLRQLGDSALQSGDKQTALEAYREVLNLESDNFNALCGLATLTKDQSEAKDLTVRASMVNPEAKIVKRLQMRFGINTTGFYNERKEIGPIELINIESRVIITLKHSSKTKKLQAAILKKWNISFGSNKMYVDLNCLNKNNILYKEVVIEEIELLSSVLREYGCEKIGVKTDDGWTFGLWST